MKNDQFGNNEVRVIVTIKEYNFETSLMSHPRD